MSILKEFWEKCKGEWFWGLVIILIALLIFNVAEAIKLTPVKTSLKIITTQKPPVYEPAAQVSN